MSIFVCFSILVRIFFKQKTAYEVRSSDWSSDVCFSDLLLGDMARPPGPQVVAVGYVDVMAQHVAQRPVDRKSVVSGKSVSVRVDLGGRRIIKKKNLIMIKLCQYHFDTHTIAT